MQALHAVKYTMYCVHTPSQLTPLSEMLEKNNPENDLVLRFWLKIDAVESKIVIYFISKLCFVYSAIDFRELGSNTVLNEIWNTSRKVTWIYSSTRWYNYSGKDWNTQVSNASKSFTCN